jgi:hypothetical protein
LGVIGFVNGRRIQSTNTAEKTELMNQKQKLEKELKRLGGPTESNCPSIDGAVVFVF